MALSKAGYPINEYKSVGRGDYGVRVARKGFDAATGADSNLLFNSNWPIIQIVKVISEENKRIYKDETQDIPASYIYQRTETREEYSVDEHYFYLPPEINYYFDPDTYTQHLYKKQYRIYHGLGYVPLFYCSKYVSDTDGYYLLTNINIRKDADYPYTAKPSSYYGMTTDYGIKSKSMTRKSLPRYGVRGCGFNTNIQSKMIMAIKTEQSKSKETSGGGLQQVPAAWAVPKSSENEQVLSDLQDFEAIGFYANDDTDGKFLQASVMLQPLTDIENGRYIIGGQAAPNPTNLKESLVIIRTPMVAPDYEEITVS